MSTSSAPGKLPLREARKRADSRSARSHGWPRSTRRSFRASSAASSDSASPHCTGSRRWWTRASRGCSTPTSTMATTERLTLTVPEAAKLLGVGRATAYEAASDRRSADHPPRADAYRAARPPRIPLER